jgi:hypothetical protein
MSVTRETDPRVQNVVKGLLGRGGAALGIAAMAHARGHRTMAGKWSALSLEMRAAVEQVLGVLEKSTDLDVVRYAVMKTMSNEQVAAPPKWAKAIVQDPELLAQLGSDLDDALLNAAIGRGGHALTPRQRGMAGMAVALCRNQDTLMALAEGMPGGDGRAMMRMARLAQATVAPGEPSSMRRRLRALLKERQSG